MIDTDTSLLIATTNSNKTREITSLIADFINPIWSVYDISGWENPVPTVHENHQTFWGNAVKKAFEVSQFTGSVTLSDDSGLQVDALDGLPGVRSARYSSMVNSSSIDPGPIDLRSNDSQPNDSRSVVSEASEASEARGAAGAPIERNSTDERNNQKLIRDLAGVPESRRQARFVSVVALAIPQNTIGRALLSRTGIPFEEIGVAEPTEEGKMVRIDNRIVVWFRGEVEGRIVDEPRGVNGFGYDPHFYVPEFRATMAEIAPAQKNEVSHRARALAKLVEFFPGFP